MRTLMTWCWMVHCLVTPGRLTVTREKKNLDLLRANAPDALILCQNVSQVRSLLFSAWLCPQGRWGGGLRKVRRLCSAAVTVQPGLHPVSLMGRTSERRHSVSLTTSYCARTQSCLCFLYNKLCVKLFGLRHRICLNLKTAWRWHRGHFGQLRFFFTCLVFTSLVWIVNKWW